MENYALISLILLLNLPISAVTAIFGGQRKIGFGMTFLISVFLTPVVGWIILMRSEPTKSEPIKMDSDGIAFFIGMLIFIAIFIVQYIIHS